MTLLKQVTDSSLVFNELTKIVCCNIKQHKKHCWYPLPYAYAGQHFPNILMPCFITQNSSNIIEQLHQDWTAPPLYCVSGHSQDPNKKHLIKYGHAKSTCTIKTCNTHVLFLKNICPTESNSTVSTTFRYLSTTVSCNKLPKITITK